MKILVVTEKTSILKTMTDCLDKHIKEIGDNIFCFTTFIPTFHINDSIMGFRVDENLNIYQHRELLKDVTWLSLEKAEIPIGTYFQYTRRPFNIVNPYDYEEIIFAPDPDANGIFGMQKFAEVNGIDDAKYYNYSDLTEAQLLPMLKLQNLQDFNNVFNTYYQKAKLNNFQADYPRKIDIERLRKNIGWTRKQFSDYFGIPYRTIENWEFFENKVPEYLFNLMIYKLKNENIL